MILFNGWSFVYCVSHFSGNSGLRDAEAGFSPSMKFLASLFPTTARHIFALEEFRGLFIRSGIRQALTAHYHPASNGQAERFVQETKRVLKKMTGSEDDTPLTH